MLSYYPHTTATIGKEILFFPFGEEEKPKLPTYFVRNTGASLELCFEESIEFGRTYEFVDTRPFFSYSEADIPKWKAIKFGRTHEFADTQCFALPSYSKEDLRAWKATTSGITQAFTDTQQQRLDFPTYSEDDILDWGVAIEEPPPRPSGTIRVKLKYKGRSKPIPIEDPWE